MALNATMYRFGIDLSDLNNNVYDSLSLHVALHPSETVERMCLRVLAYCMCYHPQLSFTKGLSTESEPDLWQVSYSDEIEHWIEIGKPDAKRLKKALGRSQAVTVFSYGGQDLEKWLADISKDYALVKNIRIFVLRFDDMDRFVDRIERSAQLSVMIQDNLMHITLGDEVFEVVIEQPVEK
jgi:uncharacterized protein YaeQ